MKRRNGNNDLAQALPRHMWKKLLVPIILLSCLILPAGCGSSSGYSGSFAQSSMELSDEKSMSSGASDDIYSSAAPDNQTEGEMDSGAEVVQEQSENHKLIRTVTLHTQTDTYDTMYSTVQKRITQLGGYVENLSCYNQNEPGSRSAELTVRIPAQNLDAFLNNVSEISNVTSRTESVEDVTLQYVDMQSHKKMLMEEQNRLLQFLEKAETIDEVIQLEQRLTQVRYELESMESQLRTMDNMVSYSTVYLYIDEVVRYTPVQTNAWQRISAGFTENVYRLTDGLKEFGIWFLIELPVLLFWAILITLAVVIMRLIVRLYDKYSRKRHPADRTANTNSGYVLPGMGTGSYAQNDPSGQTARYTAPQYPYNQYKTSSGGLKEDTVHKADEPEAPKPSAEAEETMEHKTDR